MNILFLPGSTTSPSARFRLHQFVPHLRQMGHDVTVRVIQPDRMWSPVKTPRWQRLLQTRGAMVQRVASTMLMLRDAADFDVIMMNRDIVPEVRVTLLEPWLARRNPRLIFDFDDAIHLGERGKKLAQILPLYAHITPGNPFLAEYAQTLNPNITILPTVVDTDAYFAAPDRQPGPLRIGWSGSSYSAQYGLPILEPIIKQLAQRFEIEFIAISNTDPHLHWEGVNLRYIPWTEATEVAGLQTLDIGLMPLNDEPFERGKCGLKAIQYMAVGVTPVVSPVGVNSEIVVHGETGYHCHTDQDWIDTLTALLQDAALRQRMGQAARMRAEAHYSIRSLLPRMMQVFETVTGRER